MWSIPVIISFTCSQDTQVNIKEVIDEYQLNRVVVASCTPKTHEGIFHGYPGRRPD